MPESISSSASALSESFISSALVVPVIPSGFAGRALSVPEAHKEKMAQLMKSAQNFMRKAGHIERSGDLVDGFFSKPLIDDIWYLPMGAGSASTAIILVKEAVYRQIPEVEIIEQVHRAELEAAQSRGETVPQDLLRYYRDKSRQGVFQSDL